MRRYGRRVRERRRRRRRTTARRGNDGQRQETEYDRQKKKIRVMHYGWKKMNKKKISSTESR